MITGIDLTETVEFTAKNDKENPTVWKLGVLPSFLLTSLTTQSGSPGMMMLKIVQYGVKGWTNFMLKDKPINFRTEPETINGREFQIIPMGIIDLIPMNILTELSTKLLDINYVSGEEAKN